MPGWLGWTVRTGAGGAPATPVPTLIQHIASSANPVGNGISGNNFKVPMPNPVGSGNCLVLGVSYPHGTGPTITDDNGNTWPAATVSADAGVGAYVAAIFVLPNANAGQTTLTVTFGAAVIPFQYTLSEFNNIATASAVNGSIGTADDAGAAIAAGSFTPTNNNAGGGNLIWSYFAVAGGASSNPSSFVPGSGFVLLDGDIAWTNNQGFPHATQWQVQTTAAAINPGMTATADTDGFNGVAVALKVATAGTAIPAGIHVNRIIHQSGGTPAGAGTWTLHFPVSGNLRALTANGPLSLVISGITDSEGGTWTRYRPDSDDPEIWYRVNTTANSALTVLIATSGAQTAGVSVRMYDIQGAAAAPIGSTASAPGVDVSGQTTVSNMPSITPTYTDSLILARTGLGQGPGFTVTSPAGALFSLVTYTGETDIDLMENADLEAVYHNTSTAQKNFNWTMSSQSNSAANGVAVEFKAA